MNRHITYTYILTQVCKILHKVEGCTKKQHYFKVWSRAHHGYLLQKLKGLIRTDLCSKTASYCGKSTAFPAQTRPSWSAWFSSTHSRFKDKRPSGKENLWKTLRSKDARTTWDILAKSETLVIDIGYSYFCIAVSRLWVETHKKVCQNNSWQITSR